MTIKTFATALILCISPIAAQAVCSGHGVEQQAMSCAEGAQWDTDSGTCLPVASS